MLQLYHKLIFLKEPKSWDEYLRILHWNNTLYQPDGQKSTTLKYSIGRDWKNKDSHIDENVK